MPSLKCNNLLQQQALALRAPPPPSDSGGGPGSARHGQPAPSPPRVLLPSSLGLRVRLGGPLPVTTPAPAPPFGSPLLVPCMELQDAVAGAGAVERAVEAIRRFPKKRDTVTRNPCFRVHATQLTRPGYSQEAGHRLGVTRGRQRLGVTVAAGQRPPGCVPTHSPTRSHSGTRSHYRCPQEGGHGDSDPCPPPSTWRVPSGPGSGIRQ